MKKWTLFMLLCLSFVLTGVASACGGFFCQNTPIDQSAERIIFTVNGDGTITAIVGINYVGAAEDFSWVVPVPAPPELDVAETESFDTLQQNTDVRFTRPMSYCNRLFNFWGRGGGGGGGGLFIEKGNVGPYDYAVVGGQDVTELVTWLRNNDYRVEPEMEPIIAQYVEEGMLFLAMKLSQEAEVGDIKPVQMTYRAEKPMIPIRLTAIAAVDDMPILTWIFADTQYQPENYASVLPDFSSFRSGKHEVGTLGTLDFTGGGVFDEEQQRFFSALELQYIAEQERIQAEYDGLAFITQYAGATADLNVSEDPLLLDLIERFPYMTRLRAQQSPDQMTLDPVFAPAPDAPDVSNVVNPGDYVDSLHYHGCSSRTAISDAQRELLPEGRSTSTAFNMRVAHPEGWVMTELAYEGQMMQFFAPETVTPRMVDALLRGSRTEPPLLILATDPTFEAYGEKRSMAELLGYPVEKMEYEMLNALPFETAARVMPFGYEGESPVTYVSVLASDDDWEANRATYEAMLDYATSFEHYLSRPALPRPALNLAHTLVLNSVDTAVQDDGSPLAFMIGYPEGWIEYINPDDGHVELTPADMLDLPRAERPYVRLSSTGFQDLMWDSENIPVWFEEVGSDFGFEETILEFVTTNGHFEDLCNPYVPPMPFAQDEQQGFVRPLRFYQVEAWTPDALADDYLAEMQAIVDSAVEPVVICG